MVPTGSYMQTKYNMENYEHNNMYDFPNAICLAFKVSQNYSRIICALFICTKTFAWIPLTLIKIILSQ